MKNNNEPKLRYPEFTDAWEKCKLGEVANIIMGQSPSSEFYTNNPSDYILVQGNADIKNGWVTPRIWTTQITKMGKKGDLIFSVRAPVGEIGKTKYDVVLGRGVAAIQGNEFIFQTLGRMNIFGFWKSLSTGSTFDAINSSELKNVEIHLPTLPEQQKIGALFRRLDRLITLHKRKWDDVILLKKALLQKMFPENDERLPEIRFPEFSGDWEKCKLGDLGTIEMNKRIFKEQTSTIGEIPFYKIGTFGGKADAFISKELFEEYKSKYPYPNKGDLLISASGSVGKVVEYSGKDEYFQDSNIVWFNHNGKLNNLFLKQFYSHVQWEGLEGSTIKRLYNKTILGTQISFPSLPEQQKIGTFFRRLDRLISHHQQQYEHYQLLKKALLQQMFI
ncbi:restriction endonuclease subunit S [Avibacterium paragallinarum]|uniref:restriction endonuclease subunit S n=1 Tax=Avibacterium paragallinarum TaxID=728 RepID=UPI00397D8BD6